MVTDCLNLLSLNLRGTMASQAGGSWPEQQEATCPNPSKSRLGLRIEPGSLLTGSGLTGSTTEISLLHMPSLWSCSRVGHSEPRLLSKGLPLGSSLLLGGFISPKCLLMSPELWASWGSLGCADALLAADSFFVAVVVVVWGLFSLFFLFVCFLRQRAHALQGHFKSYIPIMNASLTLF